MSAEKVASLEGDEGIWAAAGKRKILLATDAKGRRERQTGKADGRDFQVLDFFTGKESALLDTFLLVVGGGVLVFRLLDGRKISFCLPFLGMVQNWLTLELRLSSRVAQASCH
jgi:hypothetical protein